MNNIVKAFIVGLSAFGLAACYSPEVQEESRTVINSKLPEGCEFQFYGWYQDSWERIAVGAIVCDGQIASTELQWEVPSGKTTKDINTSITNISTKKEKN